LIVLKTNRDRSQIVARGSIDDTAARDATGKILAAAKEAFAGARAFTAIM